MSAGHQGNGTRSNGIDEALALATQNERGNMNIQGYGEVTAFDPATQLATVKLMRKPMFNDTPIDIPDLLEVPVLQPRSNGFCITFPVTAGDKVVVRFDDKDNKAYLQNGEPKESTTDRLNSLSDATVELTAYPQTMALPKYDTENLFLGLINGVDGLQMDETGKLSFTANGEELLTILFDLVGQLASETTTVTRGSSRGIHAITGQGAYAALQSRLEKLKRT